MHKDELLELHEQMVIIKDNFAARSEVDESIFDEYETLDVDPSHDHKSNSEYKHAVFVPGNPHASAMTDEALSHAARVGKRMAESAADADNNH